eukprot:scaffold14211_cov137-Isochrysis_galbana.AAC.1
MRARARHKNIKTNSHRTSSPRPAPARLQATRTVLLWWSGDHIPYTHAHLSHIGSLIFWILYRRTGHIAPAQRGDEIVQVGSPHARRVAEVRAVTARAPVPPVWAVGAVAEVPPPAGAGEVVEGQHADVRELAGGKDGVEGVVAGVDVEVLGG